MRGVIQRIAVVVLSVIVTAGALAAPRSSQNAAARTVKKIIRALGDFITVPTPAPAPAPKQS